MSNVITSNEYQLYELKELIEKVRAFSSSDNTCMIRYLRLQALFVYFQYFVASVHLQEENISRMLEDQNQNKKFANHYEYEDCLLKIYSSAVTSYSNLRTCLQFTKKLNDEIAEEVSDSAFDNFRDINLKWIKDAIDKRDRIAAHPEEENRIVWKPSMWNSEGVIRYRAINSTLPLKSRTISLEPRLDLERLRKYLLDLSKHYKRLWKI